jgi:hypothetical protein
MPGLRVTVNGKQLASVSNEGLNIITVQINGDVIGEELAVIEMFGGLYEGKDTDSHLIWVSDYEITSDDEVEISFLENIDTSHRGKTIEELHPETGQQMGPWQPMEEIFKDLSTKPKLRDKFSFELIPSHGETIHSSTDPNEYMFHLVAMWKWLKPDEARISLTSNTLDGIEKRENGEEHARFTLQFGQGVKLRVGT